MMGQITQRDSFFNRLYELMKADRDIVLVSADMGAPALDAIRRDLASQFVNVGIAEQNAILVSSGLALAGKKVFAYAIAPFITLRPLEQIRVQNAMMAVPITIVGVGAGFGYEDSGPTHHLLEDLAVMRAFPHVEINGITDAVMARTLADESLDKTVTNYVRLERQAAPDIYKDGDSFTDGVTVLRQGRDGYIVTTGSLNHTALRLVGELADSGLDVGVIDLYTLPVNLDNFAAAVRDARLLITIEEHFLPGGLGGAVCEALQDLELAIPVKRLGLDPAKGYCYQYGGREVLRSYYGIGYNQLKDRIATLVARKS